MATRHLQLSGSATFKGIQEDFHKIVNGSQMTRKQKLWTLTRFERLTDLEYRYDGFSIGLNTDPATIRAFRSMTSDILREAALADDAYGRVSGEDAISSDEVMDGEPRCVASEAKARLVWVALQFSRPGLDLRYPTKF